MARSLNKIQIIGNLGADPEMRAMPHGTQVARLRIATTESWKDRNTGENREHTEWHSVEAFDRLAQIMGEYLRKGSQVYVEGQLRTDKWTDQQGNDRYTTKVRANNMLMLGGRGGQSDASFAPSAPMSQPKSRPQQQPQQSAPPPMDDGFDDDIPF